MVFQTVYIVMFDSSHITDYVADRGPAKYFHGRERAISSFEKLIEDSIKTQRGSTFLIQGAPGAGKTALLHKCEKLASGKGWHVAKIKTGALWDKGKMLRTLGYGKMVGIDNVSLSLLEAFTAEVSLSKPAHSTISLNVVEKRKRKPLILILDEAQRLSKANELSKSQFDEAGDLLEAIHNGELKKPVILLAAGLGQTEEAFSSLGVSRFKGGCFVELGALDKESERAVIHDWLVREGGAIGNPDAWIDQIAQKTHGWPQHITAYGDAVAKQIQNDHGEMTTEGMEIVYQVGEERREAYYKQRAKGISGKERCSLAKLIQNIPSGKGIDKEDIESILLQEYDDSDKAKSLFKKAVERGILHSQDEAYNIPIPSMRSWLIFNYAHERMEFAFAPQLNPVLRDRDSSMESMER